MTRLPEGLRKHGETRTFDETSVPAKLLDLHDTKPGVWGRLVVEDGALDYIVPGPPEVIERISAGGFGVIEPTVLHRVAPCGSVRFRVEFLSFPEPGRGED